ARFALPLKISMPPAFTFEFTRHLVTPDQPSTIRNAAKFANPIRQPLSQGALKARRAGDQRGCGSNPSQLPMSARGHRELAGAAGLEPANAGIKTPCLTNLATPHPKPVS